MAPRVVERVDFKVSSLASEMYYFIGFFFLIFTFTGFSLDKGHTRFFYSTFDTQNGFLAYFMGSKKKQPTLFEHYASYRPKL